MVLWRTRLPGIASPGTAHHWDNNQIPVSYYWQGLHYSIVSGVHTVTFVALLAGRGLVTRDMPIVDEDVETLVAAESMFWDLVQTQTPPPVDGSDSYRGSAEAAV
jgi:predicted phage-related endonuclease